MDHDKFVPHIKGGRCLAAVRINGEKGRYLALVWETKDCELSVVADLGGLKIGRALHLIGEVPLPFEHPNIEGRFDRPIL